MPNVFLITALVFLVICALLYFAPHLKLLNFVDYKSDADTVQLNRYAAVRLLVPALVNVACSYVVALRPGLLVPLIFLTPLAVLATVVWINAGISRLRTSRSTAKDL